MAENKNSNNMNEETPRSGKPSNQKSGMSRRDRERLNKFNLDKVDEEKQKGQPTWTNRMEVDNRYSQAKDWKTKNPAPKTNQMRFKPSTSQTPARNEDPYDGESVGSKPVKKTICQNLDFAGFGILLEQVYQQATRVESRLPRMLPFPIYQHAMVEFLNAFILHQQKFGNAHPDLQLLMDPLDVIRAKDFKIPKPIYDYIVSIGPALTPAADKIVVNYSRTVIPQGFIAGVDAAPPLCAVEECSSGSFGIPAAANHNAYECYWSPLVTQKYITASISENRRRNGIRPHWTPFPPSWLPNDALLNQNLLGWHPVTRHHTDAIAKMEMCEFVDDDTISGLLCHCPYAMNLACSTLADIKISCVPADFIEKENTAAFITKRDNSADEDTLARVSDQASYAYSPFSFGSSAGNKATYFCYKRERTENRPGVFATLDGLPLPGWIDTINSNFNMVAPFAPRNTYRDRPSLREENHAEDCGEAVVSTDVFQWLGKHLIEKNKY